VEVSDILPGMETRKASAAPHGTGVRDDTPGATKLKRQVVLMSLNYYGTTLPANRESRASRRLAVKRARESCGAAN
jgi:hypothetical protein